MVKNLPPRSSLLGSDHVQNDTEEEEESEGDGTS